jgi:hypothetical protein
VVSERASTAHIAIVQCSAVQCSAVQCSAVQCSAVQCSAVQCIALQCLALQCSAVQYSKYNESETIPPVMPNYNKIKCPLKRNVQCSLDHHLQTYKHVFSFENLHQSRKRKHKIILVEKIEIKASIKLKSKLSTFILFTFPP